MKDISKAHTINTHIQRLRHKGSYRPDAPLRLFNSSVGCGEWKRTPAMMRLYQFLAGSRETFERRVIPTIMRSQAARYLMMPSSLPSSRLLRAHYGQHSRLV